MTDHPWLRARTVIHVDGSEWVAIEDAIAYAARAAKPDREALVATLDALPDYYFANGIEYGDIREMADEMLAHWEAER